MNFGKLMMLMLCFNGFMDFLVGCYYYYYYKNIIIRINVMVMLKVMVIIFFVCIFFFVFVGVVFMYRLLVVELRYSFGLFVNVLGF